MPTKNDENIYVCAVALSNDDGIKWSHVLLKTKTYDSFMDNQPVSSSFNSDFRAGT